MSPNPKRRRRLGPANPHLACLALRSSERWNNLMAGRGAEEKQELAKKGGLASPNPSSPVPPAHPLGYHGVTRLRRAEAGSKQARPGTQMDGLDEQGQARHQPHGDSCLKASLGRWGQGWAGQGLSPRTRSPRCVFSALE